MVPIQKIWNNRENKNLKENNRKNNIKEILIA
jgi:hypothetical protein